MGRDVTGLRVDIKPSVLKSNGTFHGTVHVAPKATPEEVETHDNEPEAHTAKGKRPEEHNGKQELRSTDHEPEEKIIRAQTPKSIDTVLRSPVKRASVAAVANFFETVEKQTISTDHGGVVEPKDSGLKSLAISDAPVSRMTKKESEVSAIPKKESEVSAIPKKESEASSFPEKESKASAFPEKESEASAFPEKEPDAIGSPEKDSEASAFPEKEAEASPFPEKESEPNSPPMSRKQLQPNDKKFYNEEDNWSLASSTATSRTVKSRITVPVAPRFTCAERLERRRQYYTKLEEKHKALEKERLEYEARTKEEEQSAIRQLRKSMVVKANPVPSFYREGPPPKPELKKLPVTRAKSPNLTRTKSCGDATKSSPEDKGRSARVTTRHSVGVYKESKSSPIAPKSKDRVGVRKLNGTSKVRDRPQPSKETTGNSQVQDQVVENSQVNDQGAENAVES